MSYDKHAQHDDSTRHERIKHRLLFALATLFVVLALAIVAWEMMLISSVGSRNGTGPAHHVSVEITDTMPAR
jgi:hypothetical protein